MKKISLLLIAVLIIYTLSGCGDSGSNATGLRDITWGMSRTEVLKAEDSEYLGADEGYVRFYDEDTSQPLVFYGSMLKTKVDLWYYFNSEDKLFKIQYRLIADSNMDTYNQLKKMMSELYGSPYAEDVKDSDEESITKSSWKYKKSDITLEFDFREEGGRNPMYIYFLPNA